MSKRIYLYKMSWIKEQDPHLTLANWLKLRGTVFIFHYLCIYCFAMIININIKIAPFNFSGDVPPLRFIQEVVIRYHVLANTPGTRGTGLCKVGILKLSGKHNQYLGLKWIIQTMNSTLKQYGFVSLYSHSFGSHKPLHFHALKRMITKENHQPFLCSMCRSALFTLP